MKKLIFVFLFTVVQQFLSAQNPALVVDINEFANFKEIGGNNGTNAVKSLKKAFGSRTPINFLHSGLDGTDNFPVSRNIKKALSSNRNRLFIYFNTHTLNSKDEFLIAAAESKKGKSSTFLKGADFNGTSGLMIIHSPNKVSSVLKKSFEKTFKNFNGAAILTDKEPDLSFYIQTFSQKTENWKPALLERKKAGEIICGRVITISNNEIKQLQKDCEQAKIAAEKANSLKLAPASFTSAKMKMQLLKKSSGKEPVENYFAWKSATESFYKSRAEALIKKLEGSSKEMHNNILQSFGHPDWVNMTNLRKQSDQAFKNGNFTDAGNRAEEANKLLEKIYREVSSNLLELIKQSKTQGDSETSKNLIKALVQLKPNLKLKYAFQGQTFTNNAGIKFTYVPAGKFIMGSPASETGHEGDETQHQVTISKGFYMSVTEITENQWRQVMGLNYQSDQKISPAENSNSLGSFYPQRVSWREAVKFCKALSSKEKLVYRLPTEAEWEYAARAGSQKAFSSGSVLTPNDAVTKESRQHENPSECGKTKANAWGLFDMHGNLWEWCSDWSYIYENKPQTDPKGPSEEFAQEEELDMKVVRGGSYDDPAIKARSANRWEYSPSVTSKIIGFRIILELKE